MIKWICAQLSKCFDAHLTDEEKRGKEAVKRLRQASRELNAAIKALPADIDCIIRYKEWSRSDLCTAKYFEITAINAEVKNRKEL